LPNSGARAASCWPSPTRRQAPPRKKWTGHELTGSGYSCQAITFDAPGPASGNAQQVGNSNNIQFGPAAADWLQPVAFGIFDAMTNGDLLYWNTP